jgi:hypothetical protein
MNQNKGIMAEAADTAPLVVDGSQPVWMTLNDARERAFTGEIVFETDPEVLAYLDHGVVYYAERVTDASLGRRLLEAGVIDRDQLDRGIVRVGDIEHLGRLFDRDPSIDRDAVIVVAETASQELIADLANRAVASVRLTAYRHHPSGVHRWFVAPSDPAAQRQPLSAVAQLDSAVVDDLPSLPYGDGDEIAIEWDQLEGTNEIMVANEYDASLFYVSDAPVDDGRVIDLDVSDLDTDLFRADTFDLSLDLDEYIETDSAELLAVEQLVEVEAEDVVEVEAEDVVEVEAQDVVEVEAEPVMAEPAVAELDMFEPAVFEPATTTGAPTEDFEFSVVWPDDSPEPTTEATSSSGSPVGVIEREADQDGIVTQFEDGRLEFTMPPLMLSDEPELADGGVPDDVADAVRRAIAAIESVSGPAPGVVPDESTADVFETGDTAVENLAASGAATVRAPGAAVGGFAPPTMATRAEVLYGLTEDGTAVAGSAPAGSSPAGGVGSALVEDQAAEGAAGGNERSSALRRLIGSLRRKEH